MSAALGFDPPFDSVAHFFFERYTLGDERSETTDWDYRQLEDRRRD
jgi:hypothetical protein